MRNMQTLGQLIREKRTAAGLSLRAVAGELGLSVPYLSDIELGHRRPVTKRWRAFCAVVPGLTVRAMAEASLASGPVEIDATPLTTAQRKPIVEALVRAAEGK
jgi:hypothetical protein